ncbi:hypothetical protein DL764_009447 [Monosporascus ibericus]|uniref:PAN2-PAN3 deadenylation complex subunit PAN3 n=1 Tax=Monosporascus ibericus TaxID=155417 RepID=A0A4Q4SUZ8_9PEZI|nr:hypothetical protein DL764_009447 [Monosporascus ibericus]
MANARFGNADRGGRQMASPRPKTRDAKDTLCRNVLIYGHCRYEDQGCAFNHEQHKNSPNSNDAQAAPVSSRASPGCRLEPEATPGSGAVVPSPGIKATLCQISSDDASTPATTSPTEVAEALSVLAEKVEADQLRFRSVSERLSSLEKTVDYLVSPNENAPPKMLSRNWSVTGYTNGQYADSSKKSFNVDSPSFTPAQLPGGKKSTFSTNATPFTPRGAASTANPVLPQDTGASLFKSGQFSDFAPQNYDLNTGSAANGSADSSSLGYDPFTMSNVGHTLPTTAYNPYAEDHANITAGAAPYYAAQSAYTTPLQPLNYHLYNPITPSRESLQLFQRHVQEFFVPDNVREELTRKSEAARQVLPNNKVKPASGFFGYISWVYKASSKKTGNIYCLRRIEGAWKKICHPNVVTVFEAFTTRDFNDSSLVFAHHYHPLSKTLAEHHFPSNRYGRAPPVQEKVLWSYLVQLSSALKVIHNAKLAARCIDVTKVILTDKNRVRLSACAVLDVLHFETQRQVEDLQQEDFFHLGKLILGIATNTLPRNIQDVWGSLDQVGRIYSQDLKDRISWLLSPTPQTPSAALNAQPKTAEQLLYDMAQHTADLLDVAFNANDENTAYLARELENGRLFRLAAKLGTINERPEFDGDPNWSETGERYTLKLFRDYVFHQVDANGNPVMDLGHIVSCLNKLDVGVDEKVYLTSRDNQTGFIVTYKELKKQIQTAFGDLLKGSSSSKQQSGGRAY